MKYKIVEVENHLAVHSIGYHGEEGRKTAQARVDSSYCIRHWINKSATFVVIEDTGDGGAAYAKANPRKAGK